MTKFILPGILFMCLLLGTCSNTQTNSRVKFSIPTADSAIAIDSNLEEFTTRLQNVEFDLMYLQTRNILQSEFNYQKHLSKISRDTLPKRNIIELYDSFEIRNGTDTIQKYRD